MTLHVVQRVDYLVEQVERYRRDRTESVPRAGENVSLLSTQGQRRADRGHPLSSTTAGYMTRKPPRSRKVPADGNTKGQAHHGKMASTGRRRSEESIRKRCIHTDACRANRTFVRIRSSHPQRVRSHPSRSGRQQTPRNHGVDESRAHTLTPRNPDPKDHRHPSNEVGQRGPEMPTEGLLGQDC